MPEYIDRIQFCECFCRCNAKMCAETGYRECPIFICPTADVVPVVHGKWLSASHDDQYEGEYYCSVCNAEEFFPNNSPLAPFCWHCGAKMDEEET